MNWLFYAIIAMIVQGTVLFIVKYLSLGIHPLTILFYQYIGSIIGMGAYLYFQKKGFKTSKGEVKKILLSGFLVSTGLSFYYLALGLEKASLVVPLHNVGITLLPALLAFILLKEKITKKTIIGITCSIICIVLLTI